MRVVAVVWIQGKEGRIKMAEQPSYWKYGTRPPNARRLQLRNRIKKPKGTWLD
jgi:hypothetical protein